MKKKAITIQKPTLSDTATALAFAEGSSDAARAPAATTSQNALKSTSGQIPQGDVRLTANISEDRHLKIKMEAVKRRTTIGELIEQMIDQL